MAIWALSDLHLSFGVPNKKMEIFNPCWQDHPQKIQTAWEAHIQKEDLVLVAGDISWGMRLEEALPDLQWLDSLPGTKLLIRGNHDYWWSSAQKLSKLGLLSLHYLHNSVFFWEDCVIGGTRLWDTEEYDFNAYIDFRENPLAKPKKENEKEQAALIFTRELERLEKSLRLFPQGAHKRIAMTHYPPIGATLLPSRAATLLEKYGVSLCVFGHLHQLKAKGLFGKARGVQYVLTSCDYLDFIPIRLL